MDFQEIATGYVFLEAPRADGEAIWFSDPIQGGLYRIWPNGKIDSFVPDMKRIGGACLNADGKVICSTTGGIAWFDPTTRKSGMLVDGINGKSILGGNDIFPDGKGGLYFGTVGLPPETAGEPAKLTELYRVDPDGHVTLLWDELHIPNGIGLSPDGRRLYMNETWRGTFAYDVAPDGTLSNRTLFSSQPDCDGLTIDEEGGVWIACLETGAVIRVHPDGTLDRQVKCPVKNVSSICFGGPDGRDMFITTGGNEGLELLIKGEIPPPVASLYRGQADIAGLPVPVTNFQI